MQYYTVKEVIAKHRFTQAYINKCINRLEKLFNGHIIRGDNNSRLFDSEGMNVFDSIAQMKQAGQSIAEIEKALLRGYDTIITSPIEPIITDTTPQNQLLQFVEKYQQKLEAETEKRIRLQAEMNEIIRQLEQKNQALTGTVKTLTDGRSPEEVQRQWKEDQRRSIQIKALFTELKTLGIANWWRRSKILKELDELLGK